MSSLISSPVCEHCSTCCCVKFIQIRPSWGESFHLKFFDRISMRSKSTYRRPLGSYHPPNIIKGLVRPQISRVGVYYTLNNAQVHIA